MPNYDFQCARDGVFEDLSNVGDNGVESRSCPKCGELAPQVWRRAPAVRNDNVHAIRFGGRVVPMDQAEQMLDAPDADDEADAFWNKPDFEQRYHDTLNEKANLSAYGNLPPAVPEDANSQKVLTAEMAKMAKESV